MWIYALFILFTSILSIEKSISVLLLILWRCLFSSLFLLFFLVLHCLDVIWFLYLSYMKFLGLLKFVAWCFHQCWNSLSYHPFKYFFHSIFFCLPARSWVVYNLYLFITHLSLILYTAFSIFGKFLSLCVSA